MPWAALPEPLAHLPSLTHPSQRRETHSLPSRIPLRGEREREEGLTSRSQRRETHSPLLFLSLALSARRGGSQAPSHSVSTHPRLPGAAPPCTRGRRNARADGAAEPETAAKPAPADGAAEHALAAPPYTGGSLFEIFEYVGRFRLRRFRLRRLQTAAGES